MNVHNTIIRISYFLSVFFFWSCSKEDLELIKSGGKDIVATSYHHLAFPDLVRVDNTWFLTYRESDAHVNSSFSIIKVLKSHDFINWTEINSFELHGYDLRDPKFSYNDLDGMFYLHIHAVSSVGNYTKERRNLITSFDNVNMIFHQDLNSKLELSERFSNDWLWRPEWEDGAMYVGGYSDGVFRLYKYDNINELPHLLYTLSDDFCTESTIRFQDDKIVAIVRGTKKTFLGTALKASINSLKGCRESLPINWQYLAIADLGGPNMVILDDVAYIGGRVKDGKTGLIVYSLRDNKIESTKIFNSYGDNSYPGLVLHNDCVYGVYYTQSKSLNKYIIRTFIYPIKIYENDK